MVWFSAQTIPISLLLLICSLPWSEATTNPSSIRGSTTHILKRRELLRQQDKDLLARRATDADGNGHPPLDTPYYFDQRIDHKNPKLGTFKMEYFHSWQYYQPGGPIIIALGGEDDLTPISAVGELSTESISGEIARREKGAVVALEHRFFGQSQPFKDLSEKHLKYLTIQQSIDDLEYFAKNVVLPMPGGSKVNPDNTPWILVGGSYSGALTAWTMLNKPGLFWAGYASSAVVQPLIDFWRYYEPAREFMPAGCSTDVARVVGHIDSVFQSRDTEQIDKVKSAFGLKGVSNADFANIIKTPIADWQQQHAGDTTGPVFEFCEMLGHKANSPATGLGLNHAFTAWARNSTAIWRSECNGSRDKSCIDYSDPAAYDSEPTLHKDHRDATRAWAWMYCNEMGWFQVGPPPPYDKPHIVSSAERIDAQQRQCAFTFPETFTTSSLPKVNETIESYHGFDIEVDRVFFVNGKRDPWREVTLSASTIKAKTSPKMPVHLAGGYHCDDMAIGNGKLDASIAKVQELAFSTFSTWMKEWRAKHHTSSTSAGNDGQKVFGAINGEDEALFSTAYTKALLRNSYILMGMLGLALLLLIGVIAALAMKRTDKVHRRQKSASYKPIMLGRSAGGGSDSLAHLPEKRYSDD